MGKSSYIPKISFGLLICVNIVVLGLAISTLQDGIMQHIYYSKGPKGEPFIQSSAFIISLQISIFLVVFSLISSAIGIFGDIKNKYVKITIMTCMTIAILLNLAEIIILFVEPDLSNKVKLIELLTEEINKFFAANSSAFLDTIQFQLHCCGIFGWRDYQRKSDGKDMAPKSCLLPYAQEGCLNEFIFYINLRWSILFAFYVVSMIFQIVSLVFVFVFGQKKEHEIVTIRK